MAESDKGKRVESSREMASTNTSFFPRDLLQSFIPASSEPDDDDEDDDEDDEDKIELNLGLSLGGRFGIDKTGTGLNKLTRSSSVVGTMPICREEKPTAATAGNTEKEAVTTEGCPSSAARSTGLTRTTSLPVETEEEWRKRKEMQTLRRMAAKRRRNEKLRSSKNQEDSGSGRGRATAAASSSSPGLPRWSAAANKGGFLRQQRGDSRQGSVESQGGGSGGGGSSSSLSELESRPPQASSNCSEEARTVTPTTQGANTSNRLRRLSSVDMNMQGKGKNEMPCVFTKGEGPNGRRVDGILYRYGKGSEVRIMCVCHGTFLSPAEFVKHAGGGDVDHPLRHIVVNTASSSVM